MASAAKPFPPVCSRRTKSCTRLAGWACSRAPRRCPPNWSTPSTPGPLPFTPPPPGLGAVLAAPPAAQQLLHTGAVVGARRGLVRRGVLGRARTPPAPVGGG